MDVIYQNWGTFGQVVGGASGALVGLLFVAVSLNRTRIVKHVVLRASALQNLAQCSCFHCSLQSS